jgi:hypothetical protein
MWWHMAESALRARSASIDDVLAEVRELKRIVEQRFSQHCDDSDELTILAAAAICCKSAQTLRNWCEVHGLGVFDEKARRYVISRRKLRSFLINKYGRAPDELRA